MDDGQKEMMKDKEIVDKCFLLKLDYEHGKNM